MDWRGNLTCPAVARYGDERGAQHGAERFVQALFQHGTTAALAFSTVHEQATHALFDAAHRQGMRMVTGKVLMDRHVPLAVRDDVPQAHAACRRLIDRWHGTGRCAYAVTPRFAPTSSEAQLAMAADLIREDPSLYLQTHVAENQDEVRWVRELFPDARSYLDVYAARGLLTRRTVLAHGIWLNGVDRAQLRDVGATTTILVGLLREQEATITPQEATLFALGIYEETGFLTFTNTTEADLHAAAFCLSHGANLTLVTDFIRRELTAFQVGLLTLHWTVQLPLFVGRGLDQRRPCQ